MGVGPDGVESGSRIKDQYVGVAQPRCVFLVNRVFVPCQKGAIFTKTARMTNLHSNPLKTRVWLLRPPKTTKMTKMAGVTREKAWFRKGQVCSSPEYGPLQPKTSAESGSERAILARFFTSTILVRYTFGSTAANLDGRKGGRNRVWVSKGFGVGAHPGQSGSIFAKSTSGDTPIAL